MASKQRFKTTHPGVFYREARRIGGPGVERIYYIVFKKNGKVLEEKVGRQYVDDMTPARANQIRNDRIEGRKPSKKEEREKREAERQAQEAKLEAERNRWTIARLWEEYKTQNSHIKAIDRDEDRFNCYLKEKLGSREPRDLVPLDLDRIRIKLQKTLKPATVRNVLELLRRLINFGIKKQLCDGPSFKIEMPTVHNIKTEDLTPEQLARLLEEIDKEPDIQAANFMRLVLFTGMRRGEVFKLQWSHVDFARGFINIVDPKGGPSQKIPLNASARDLLESHPRSDSEYVFPGRGGGQRVDTPQPIENIKKAAGLPKDFRPLHGLRHVYASMLASSGEVDMYTLQKLLTHKSPMMTQRYAHLRDEALKRASDLARDLINQAVSANNQAPGLSLVR